jgi:endo-1,4-beta-D-glucanase Y
MRRFNRTILIATILILVVAAITGPLAIQRAQASPTNALLYPYNQTTSVAFNIADVTNAWTAYKNARVTTNGAGGGVRVLWDDSSSTVSEGMGYGMLFTVMFDEQSNFDGMWKYVSQHLDANGLMNWKIDSGGATTGTGAATDGDEDIALALVFACVKSQKGAWAATSPSGYNYCTLATTMINAIYNTEIDKAGSTPPAGLNNNPGNELLPGDTWTLEGTYPNGIVNLSYFSPGHYTVFGKFTGNTSQWEAVNTRNYAITNLAQAQSGNCSKLVPNWSTYNGAAQSVSWQTTEYGWWSWDAARFAWRVAVDKAWYNTANAQETMNEVGGFFSSVGISNVKAQYQLNGTSVDSYDSAFFNANAAAAIWAAPSPIAVNCGAATATLKSTPQQAYDRLLAINDATSYYSSAWRLFGLMLITGNFPNIYELGNGASATPTRTNTAGITPTLTRTSTLPGMSPSATRTFTPGPTFTRTRTPTVGTPVITNTPTRTATPTAGCIFPTAELLRVSPVTSPTSATTQVITVTLNNGISVSVTGPAGTFTSTTPVGGVFSVTVNLVTNSTNALTVMGTVQVSPGCTYTLSTSVDTNSNPLTIVQNSGGPTNTPTRTPTVTPVITPTITPTQPTGGCSPVTSTITAPFTYDGAGTFCWQSSNLGSYVNSWNLTTLSINGANFTNLYVASGSYPAKIGGYWYVSYNSSVAWGHFEAK